MFIHLRFYGTLTFTEDSSCPAYNVLAPREGHRRRAGHMTVGNYPGVAMNQFCGKLHHGFENYVQRITLPLMQNIPKRGFLLEDSGRRPLSQGSAQQ